MVAVECQVQLAATIGCANTLGEGVVWDPRQDDGKGAVLWTDIEGRALFRAFAPFNAFERFDAPERVGSFALVPDGCDSVIAAFESGFARFNFVTGAVEWIHRPDLPANVRFNDGRVDRSGTFWAGTMGEMPDMWPAGPGELFALTPDGQGGGVGVSHVDGIGISNALCWSPDGAVMYFADSPVNTIWAFDCVDGVPTNRRVFAQTPADIHPDGSCVDADGCVWNAQWGASRVVRYTPDGREDVVVPIPAPHVTCPAFGGADLNQLFVTTARADMDEAGMAAAPDAGAVFVFDTPFCGLPETVCTFGA